MKAKESGSSVGEVSVEGVVSGTMESERSDPPQIPEEPSVEIADADVLQKVVEVRNLVVFDRMNLDYRKAVRDRIKTALFGQSGEGTIDSGRIIKILSDCMPRGIQKPEWAGLCLRHGICRDDEEMPDTETTINCIIKGVTKCRIVVEEDGVRMYVKRGSDFELYYG